MLIEVGPYLSNTLNSEFWKANWSSTVLIKMKKCPIYRTLQYDLYMIHHIYEVLIHCSIKLKKNEEKK